MPKCGVCFNIQFKLFLFWLKYIYASKQYFQFKNLLLNISFIIHKIICIYPYYASKFVSVN